MFYSNIENVEQIQGNSIIPSFMLPPSGQQVHDEMQFVWLMILWYNAKFIDMDFCASSA